MSFSLDLRLESVKTQYGYEERKMENNIYGGNLFNILIPHHALAKRFGNPRKQCKKI